MRWAAPNFFPALLVCKLSRRSWDLGGKKKSVFHAICRASHAFSDTARGLGFFFFRTGINLGFLSVLLFKCLRGDEIAAAAGRTRNLTPERICFSIQFTVKPRLTGCTQTHPLIPQPQGVLTGTKKNQKNKNSIYSYIATPKSPKRLPFRQPTFAIKHKDWRVGTLYSHCISQTSPC